VLVMRIVSACQAVNQKTNQAHGCVIRVSVATVAALSHRTGFCRKLW
jgi:hypothetical protein